MRNEPIIAEKVPGYVSIMEIEKPSMVIQSNSGKWRRENRKQLNARLRKSQRVLFAVTREPTVPGIDRKKGVVARHTPDSFTDHYNRQYFVSEGQDLKRSFAGSNIGPTVRRIR